MKLSEFNIFTAVEKIQLENKRKQNFIENNEQLEITIAATFTAEPIEDYIVWWCKQFNIDGNVHFAPYNQVFQQLLDPQSLISTNKGLNILLVRFEDWIRNDETVENEQYIKLEENFEKLIRILENHPGKTLYLVGIFPVSTHLNFNINKLAYLKNMNNRWQEVLSSRENIQVIDFTTLDRLYGITEIFAPQKDREGHLPFTDEFYAAMGTFIARKICAWKRPPFKVIILDCDQTLWNGICGEDGELGVTIDQNFAALQRFMIEKHNSGMLLALCSKNNEQDVWDVFEKNPQMLLGKEHLVSYKINWKSKSQNIKSLAAELNLGLESMIFLDDSPVECMQVMEECPSVLSIQLPQDANQIPLFLEHIWAFDIFKMTEEDQNRTKMYLDEKKRQELQDTKLSLDDFIISLELKMSINVMEPSQLSRVAQLTQRTNQFNLSTIRRTEEEINILLKETGTKCWVVEVEDKFGDYGLVGVIITKEEGKNLIFDTFLLSCRVLGREVEKAILNCMGKYSHEVRAKFFKAKFYPTSKNKPFLEFLEQTGWETEEEVSDYTTYRLEAVKIPCEENRIKCYYQTQYPKKKSIINKVDTYPYQFYLEKTQLNIIEPIQNRWEIKTVNRENLLYKNYLLVLENHSSSALLKLPVYQVDHKKILRTDYAAPTNELEEKMVDIWQKLLGLEKIGINDNFFELGGHSLKAITLVSHIYKEYNVEISLTQIFQKPTIKLLVNYINGLDKRLYYQIESVTEKEYYMVSSAQKRLYLLDLIGSNNIAYNLPSSFIIEGNLNLDKLEKTFQKLIQRHESLRTSFAIINAIPVQKIHQEIDFKIKYFETQEHVLPEIIKEFIRPFDLSQAPLFRVCLVSIETEKYILLVDMHHIISDGVSISILIREFGELYAGKELPELRIQYKEFSEWQNQYLYTDYAKQQREYWTNQFADEIPVLNLPMDYPRPVVQSFEGNRIPFIAEPKLVKGLQRITHETGTTMFMVLLASFNVLLSRYTGQEDLVVGTPIAGRLHSDLNNVVGMFVNTLTMRNQPIGEKSFSEFLNEVKEKALKAYENQEYQFDEMVEHLKITRDLGRNPLFDVMFAMQNFTQNEINLTEQGLRVKPYDFGNPVAKFDLTLSAFEIGEKISFNLEYCTKLFAKETIERMTGHLLMILEQISGNSDIKLSEIELMTEKEKYQILYEFNNTKSEYPKDKTIHELFEEQVAKTPDNVAAVYEDQRLTYWELNQKVNQLARMLREKGVGPDKIVGIMVERSLEMIIGIMAILKAGGAYLPIDPEYPGERIKYMLMDSETKILLTQSELISKVGFDGTVLDVNDRRFFRGSGAELPKVNTARDLAYIIYTSGSTGQPKGVMIEHRAVHNFIQGLMERIDFAAAKTILALTTISFDIFGLETLLALTKGLKIVIASEKEQLDPKFLSETIIQNQIEMLQITPSRLRLLLSDGRYQSCFENVTEIMIGGEALPESLLNEVRNLTRAKIYNMYGPTETTIWSTVKDLTADTAKMAVNIGTPIANTQIYILDPNNRPQPVGVAGELYIAGDGLARGYWQRPELTAEKFIFNPFHDDYKLQITDSKLNQLNSENFNLQSGLLNLKSNDDYKLQITDSKLNQLNSENFNLQSGLLNLKSNRRMYRTGDLAKWLPDGNIEFLGRTDHQVKIRGYRIELEEIENRLLQHEAIQGAAVIDKVGENGLKSLHAYYVAGRELTVAELREHLEQSLPDYMIPASFIQLERIPQTPSGKIDRKALPQANQHQSDSGVEYAPPQTVIENQLAIIWQELLTSARVGIHDNFFTLGGNSLLVVLMHNRMDELYPGKVDVTDIFAYPTIARLAQFIETGAKAKMIKLEELIFPEEYFGAADEESEDLVFKFQISGTRFAGLKKIADRIEVGLYELLLATYFYLLAEISEQQTVVVQRVLTDTDQVMQLKIDLSEIADLSNLFQTVKQKCAVNSNSAIYNIQHLNKIRIAKSRRGIIPFFAGGYDLTRKTLAHYDLLFNIKSVTNDQISLTCSYNKQRLKKQPVEKLINAYLKLIEIIMERMDSQ
jgi:amino acid adenylation domain-containing protein/FkbH-like protein